MTAVPKPTTYRSDKHLAFVRSLPCLAPVCQYRAEPHHAGGIVSGRGVGHKGSDYRTIPLCALHHRLAHLMGKATFFDKVKVDISEAIIRTLEMRLHDLDGGKA